MAHVYFLLMLDPSNPGWDFELVKLGMTDGDVICRIAELQTGNPFELRCADAIETPYAREVEHFMHRAHAAKMQHLEWLRWPRATIPALVAEAREAARRIETRKARECAVAELPSNDIERRPSQEELGLLRQARDLTKQLVPAKLRRTAAEATLKSLTGSTLGIEGVVRVTYHAGTTRLDTGMLEASFPRQAEACRVNELAGSFLWRSVARPSDFC
jgi:hypothetical protein